MLWLQLYRWQVSIDKQATGQCAVQVQPCNLADPFVFGSLSFGFRTFVPSFCLSVVLSACHNIFYKCVECFTNQSQAQNLYYPLQWLSFWIVYTDCSPIDHILLRLLLSSVMAKLNWGWTGLGDVHGPGFGNWIWGCIWREKVKLTFAKLSTAPVDLHLTGMH